MLLQMRDLKNCEIYLSRPDKVYRPGECLSGQVKLNLNSNKIIHGIYILITGTAKVCWSKYPIKDENNVRSRNIFVSYFTSYTNKENYIKEKFYILGKRDGEIKLAKGYHIYNFKYRLPTKLPPSFEGAVGKIKYKIKVVLDRPFKINKYIETIFIVETLCTIREHPKAHEHKKIKSEQQFGDISKPKSIVAITTPTSGFAKGQIIRLALKVTNNSDTIINNISITLKQITTFRAKRTRKKEKRILWNSNINSNIGPKTTSIFKQSLKISSKVILYDLTNCKIINCDYTIKVRIYALGFNEKLIARVSMYPLRKLTDIKKNENVPKVVDTSFK